jgi:mRNA interferase MazF
MMNYDAGDIVEVPFPFIDNNIKKRRPALVLSSAPTNNKQEVFVLAMITSAKRSHWETDVTLKEWKAAGLKNPSIVRWKIFTLEKTLILDKRGKLSDNDYLEVSAGLKKLFKSFL